MMHIKHLALFLIEVALNTRYLEVVVREEGKQEEEKGRKRDR